MKPIEKYGKQLANEETQYLFAEDLREIERAVIQAEHEDFFFLKAIAIRFVKVTRKGFEERYFSHEKEKA